MSSCMLPVVSLMPTWIDGNGSYSSDDGPEGYVYLILGVSCKIVNM